MYDINLYYDTENPENNIINNPLQLFLQEIELAIKTAPNESWGFRHSIDNEKYVFNKFLSLKDIEEEISYFVSKYCSQASNFNYQTKAEFLEIDGEVILYLKMTVSYGKQTLTQKFYLA